MREALQSRFAGIPDVHHGDDQHIVAGDTGISKWTLRGTPTVTGVRIEVRGCDVFDFREGKVTRNDSYWKIVEPRDILLHPTEVAKDLSADAIVCSPYAELSTNSV